MKQILVIGGVSKEVTDVEEITHYANGVQQTLAGEAEVYWVNLDKLCLIFAPGDLRIYDTKQGRELRTYDMVILRSKMRTYSTIAYCLSKYCERQNIRHFNDYSAYYVGNKIAQAVAFYEQDLPFLKTVFSLDHDVLLQAISSELAFPCVLKDAYGAHGLSNYLVHSIEEAREVLQKEPHVLFIVQEFCPNDRDYRLLIADDAHLVFVRRSKGRSHLNNTSQGGQAQLASDEVPAGVLAQAHGLARSMELALAGVDVIPRRGTDDFYFLEVNSQPQIFTGALLPEKADLYGAFIRARLSSKPTN